MKPLQGALIVPVQRQRGQFASSTSVRPSLRAAGYALPSEDYSDVILRTAGRCTKSTYSSP